MTLLVTHPLFAVVDISPVEIGDKAGFSGNLAGSLVTKRGNTDKDEYLLSTKLQYDESDAYVTWGVVSYEYGESSGVKNEDKTYAHLRHIRRLHQPSWCGELFGQHAQDSFKNINNRSLAGAGVRWRFLNGEGWGKGYLGLGGFYEYIEYADGATDPAENNGRINSYIAYTKRFLESSKLNYIGYYQPKMDTASDYVMTQTLELLVPVYNRLNLSFKLEYDYDNRPGVGVKKEDISQMTAFSWQF